MTVRIIVERPRKRPLVLFDTYALNPWRWLRRAWVIARAKRLYKQAARRALPDGTRVRLLCPPSCADRHAGIYRTEWSPRRVFKSGQPYYPRAWEAPDDYHVVRESDGDTHFATRDALEVVQ